MSPCLPTAKLRVQFLLLDASAPYFVPATGKLIQWLCYSWTTMFGSRLNFTLFRHFRSCDWVVGAFRFYSCTQGNAAGFPSHDHPRLRHFTCFPISAMPPLSTLGTCCLQLFLSLSPLLNTSRPRPLISYTWYKCGGTWHGCLIKDTWLKSSDTVRWTLPWR